MTQIEKLKKKGQMPLAALYARFSSDNQRAESIDAQLRAMHKFCDDNGITVVGHYCDYAKSATTDNRPQFLQMIDDAKTGKFNLLIVHKLDRFSRNRKDSSSYKAILEKYHVALISVLEQMDDSPESIILESTLEGLSEYYSRNLSREVMKGMRESALNCQFTGGQAPFGFKVDKETLKFMVNEEEAQIVRLIFQLVADGVGYTEILNRLKAIGVKTRRGNDFSKPSLYELLRNEKYNGVYIFNRAVSKDVDGKRNNHRSKPLDEQIRTENGMPRIVDAELFETVQQILDNRKRGTHTGIKREYPLAGSVFCGQCGHRCSGDVMLSGHAVKTPVGIYTCNNRANRGAQACQSKTIRQEPLEAFVREKISNVIFAEENIPGVLQAYERFVQAQENDDSSNIKIMRVEFFARPAFKKKNGSAPFCTLPTN